MGNKKNVDEYIVASEAMPTEKDPFWPEGAEPLHLSKAELNNKQIVDEYKAIKGDVWRCRVCGTETHMDKKDKTKCSKCAAAVVQNSSVAITMNSNWMEQSEALGLEIFERQPEENDLEWRIWTTYRNYYPLKLPTHGELAAQVGCAVGTVTKAMHKWSYKVRLIAWARYTDADAQEERILAVREMNKKQLTMAQTMQEKLKTAIDTIDPMLLKPNEIVNMMKLANELEDRILRQTEEKVESTLVESSQKEAVVTKPEDMGEIIKILNDSGLLDKKKLGIETTTTTRVVTEEVDQ